MINFIIHLTVQSGALGVLSWPLRSYSRIASLALAGSIGFASAAIVANQVFYGSSAKHPNAGAFVLGVVILWVFSALPLWIVVRVRNHWWPVDLHAHCQKCGYDLTGNVSGTCPECGTRIGE